jgi:hypothetical protein
VPVVDRIEELGPVWTTYGHFRTGFLLAAGTGWRSHSGSTAARRPAWRHSGSQRVAFDARAAALGERWVAFGGCDRAYGRRRLAWPGLGWEVTVGRDEYWRLVEAAGEAARWDPEGMADDLVEGAVANEQTRKTARLGGPAAPPPVRRTTIRRPPGS